MLGGIERPEIAFLLEETAPDFEVSARRAFEGILGLPTFSPRDFHVAASAVNENDRTTCRIHTSNEDYDLTLSVGIDGSDLHRCFPEYDTEEMKLDVIGEIANVIAGRLLGRGTFKSRFGIMKPTVPSFSADSGISVRSRCVRGDLIFESVRFFLGLVVNANKKAVRDET